MQIDWWTLALQAINFLILVWLLHRFLYRPVREIVAKRKQLAEQAFAEADAAKQKAVESERRYKEDRTALREERDRLLAQTRRDMEAERQKLLDEAQQEANAIIGKAQADIAEDHRAASNKIRDEAGRLAVEIAAQLLAQTDGQSINQVALQYLDKAITDMAPAAQEKLQQDLSTDGARLHIVTASQLTAEEQQHWLKVLGTRLPVDGITEFSTDSGILGGAELRLPNTTIRFTWLDQLRQIEDRLRDQNAG